MSKKISVLLAEDDENLGQLLFTYLQNKGFQVILTRNGKAAYERFTKDSFDFCVFDVMMPEMGGFTLAKEIREVDKKVPILFLSAKAMKEDKLHGFDVGADDYLTKPFSMEELLARMNVILKRVMPEQIDVNSQMFIGKIK